MDLFNRFGKSLFVIISYMISVYSLAISTLGARNVFISNAFEYLAFPCLRSGDMDTELLLLLQRKINIRAIHKTRSQ